MKTLKQLALLALGCGLCGGLLYFGGVDRIPGPDEMLLWPLAGGFLLTTAVAWSVAVRWGILANALSQQRLAGWHDYYFYYISCLVVGLAVPKDLADFGGRTVWLRQAHKIDLARAGTSVVVDRICDILTALLFLVAALPFWLGWVDAAWGALLMGAAAIAVLALLFLRSDLLLENLDRGIGWTARAASRLPFVADIEERLPRLGGLEGNLGLRLFLLSICKFGCVVASLVLYAEALDIPIPSHLFLLGAPVAQVAYLFAFTPGGLGILELGWFTILTLGGVASESASAYVVIQRLLVTLLLVALVGLSYGYYALAAIFGGGRVGESNGEGAASA